MHALDFRNLYPLIKMETSRSFLTAYSGNQQVTQKEMMSPVRGVADPLSNPAGHSMTYILVTGGVISGIGKGVFSSSVGALLKACNIRVTTIQVDPYVNIDAGKHLPHNYLLHSFVQLHLLLMFLHDHG